MKSSDSTSSNLLIYSVLFVLLAGLSGLAIFIVINDKDLQVVVKDYRRVAGHRHLDFLDKAIRDHIASTDIIALCDNPSQSLQDLDLATESSVHPLNHSNSSLAWTRREKEARSRCLDEASEQRTKRACFVINHGEAEVSDRFLESQRALLEVQVQIREKNSKKAIPCDRLTAGDYTNFYALVYYSVYWLPATDQPRNTNLQMRTHGVMQALGSHLAAIQSPAF